MGNYEIKQIDRYEVKSTLGEGAMGKVLLGFDPKLHREVAIKVISESAAAKPKARERFHREARAIAALHHPNIVEIYDYSGADSKYLYLVMERLEGVDLFDLMDRFGPLPEAVVAGVGHELCMALEHAHTAGVIHRDLKPENVFLDSTGRVVLTDFGIAKAFAEDNRLQTGSWSAKTEVIGTPGFMAPEQMLNRTMGPRTDIFALGTLLYNILTGKMPFEAPNPTIMFKQISAGNYANPRDMFPEISTDMVALLDGCLQAKPKKRPRSMNEVRQELRRIIVSNGVSDLREDLREYLRDPPGFRKRSNRRLTSYILERLKIAIKDHNQAKIKRYQQRLMEIDPQNAAINEISGIMPLKGLEYLQNTAKPIGLSFKSRVVKYLIITSVLLTGSLVTFMVFMRREEDPTVDMIHPIRGQQPIKEHAGKPNVKVSQVSLQSDIAAKYWIDGKLLSSKSKMHRIKVDYGKHSFRATSRRGRTLRGTFDINDKTANNFIFDFKKRRIRRRK